jgi:hypothetical protein
VLARVITLEMVLSSANVETSVSFSRQDALRRSNIGCALAVAGGGIGAIGCSVLASAGGGVTRATSGVRVGVGAGGRGHRSGRWLRLDIGGIGSHHVRRHMLDRVAAGDAGHH